MEILISILCGVLFTVGTYLILSRNMTKIIIGTAVLSHGVHLLLLTMGGLKLGAAPLLGYEEAAYSDPLPQALILTAIVISFGVTSFLLVLAYRTYKVHGTVDMDKLRGMKDDE
ncbi:cation:proton antiporter [Alkalihalobacillus alcalophilus ATCC 27647 = CGMCC 1.3604]|uniref:Cation:proton antiporter n=1 Tax=Alkalihalobacillus alcalophilus ATCC 27647 = CGMCC 1.3604 TaxID=1218173 RepID=J8Q5K9_ALKAL|nr:Na(+)/H(+) antiporter subunit C [Alkalihalobacillus alcalophilus]AFV25931.1 multicomponent sodium ion:proton antiporter transporter [Alkalihalobacillus alcalophilus ATCC 27647 = CGMCC 1.3604]KGA98480.1 monovalent cation/H+ antiporter subunit C [Alkalihalobacillus alcalophilus ATCC 27647 = CGMCC 1.3604]MED1562912.1 Na(+)/H(+) antiporter subunit C [Alkalihalobacillus alcalophilus]THG91725.1 cation:proton antiporter [Alkalihalobacillus alcalophilus ATCC 27647 = CGMCC 1.3604]